MKKLELVSCQKSTHRNKRSGHEQIVIPNHLERQFSVTDPNQVWYVNVTYSAPRVQGEHECSNEPRVIVPVTHDEKPNNPARCDGGEPEWP